MNTQLLQKCVDELKKDKPDLSYLRGVLETLISLSGAVVTTSPIYNTSTPLASNPIIRADEERIPDAAGIGPIGNLRY